MSEVLEKEWETYEQQRARLLEAHAGEFVLIHQGEVIDFFATEMEAANAGYRRLGPVPFLVKEIVEVETPRLIICHTVRG